MTTDDLTLAPVDLLEESPFSRDDGPAVLRVEPLPIERAMAEPRSVSPMVSGDGTFERPVFGVSEFDPLTSPHPFDGACKACSLMVPPRTTKLDLLWRNMDQRAPDGRWLYRGWLPVNCCDDCYAAAKADGRPIDKQLELWRERCPIDFRDSWDATKGDAKLLTRVLQFDPRMGRGLLIHGSTDTAKTRAVWRLLRKLTEDGTEWLFVEAIDLLDNIPDAARYVPVLVIDDLGNDVLTPKNEVRLLKILRVRADWHRPTIITTQFSGDALAKRFTETATAQAVIRRLRKFCDDVQARAVVP